MLKRGKKNLMKRKKKEGEFEEKKEEENKNLKRMIRKNNFVFAQLSIRIYKMGKDLQRDQEMMT